jgi:hypothetical protein
VTAGEKTMAALQKRLAALRAERKTVAPDDRAILDSIDWEIEDVCAQVVQCQTWMDTPMGHKLLPALLLIAACSGGESPAFTQRDAIAEFAPAFCQRMMTCNPGGFGFANVDACAAAMLEQRCPSAIDCLATVDELTFRGCLAVFTATPCVTVHPVIWCLS